MFRWNDDATPEPGGSSGFDEAWARYKAARDQFLSDATPYPPEWPEWVAKNYGVQYTTTCSFCGWAIRAEMDSCPRCALWGPPWTDEKLVTTEEFLMESQRTAAAAAAAIRTMLKEALGYLPGVLTGSKR